MDERHERSRSAWCKGWDDAALIAQGKLLKCAGLLSNRAKIIAALETAGGLAVRYGKMTKIPVADKRRCADLDAECDRLLEEIR